MSGDIHDVTLIEVMMYPDLRRPVSNTKEYVCIVQGNERRVFVRYSRKGEFKEFQDSNLDLRFYNGREGNVKINGIPEENWGKFLGEKGLLEKLK